MSSLTPTQVKIHESAVRHFLKDGFQKASLRKIVSEAGFTLGAFYGYYSSKEELFDALVAETADGIIEVISGMGDKADRISPDQRVTSMSTVFSDGLPDLLEYLLSHLDETRLLLKSSGGTKYEHFLDALMERDLAFASGITDGPFPLSPLAARLLVNSYFSLLGDAALSGASRDEIKRAMQDIQDMYSGGMIYLLKGKSNV